MGTIAFEGNGAFEVVLQRPPIANCEGGAVVVILPVFVPASPSQAIGVRIPLSVQHAEQLIAELRDALATARANRGDRG